MDLKDTLFSRKRTMNCGGVMVDLSTPKVMAIFNSTPDSFYDGGRYNTEREMADRFEQIVSEGADIIDIGGWSSRPGSEEIPAEVEIDRISKALAICRRVCPGAVISLDTCRSEVARYGALEFGVSMINDISAGLKDGRMFVLAAELGLPLVIMHMQGDPLTMQVNPLYTDLLKEVLAFFAERIHAARQCGVHDLIIDPGFGFGKRLEDNYRLLSNLGIFDVLELPLMVGISRKSMIYKSLGISAQEALNGTTALNMAALLQGADILRVHDVKEAVETVRLFNLMRQNN